MSLIKYGRDTNSIDSRMSMPVIYANHNTPNMWQTKSPIIPNSMRNALREASEHKKTNGIKPIKKPPVLPIRIPKPPWNPEKTGSPIHPIIRYVSTEATLYFLFNM